MVETHSTRYSSLVDGTNTSKSSSGLVNHRPSSSRSSLIYPFKSSEGPCHLTLRSLNFLVKFCNKTASNCCLSLSQKENPKCKFSQLTHSYCEKRKGIATTRNGSSLNSESRLVGAYVSQADAHVAAKPIDLGHLVYVIPLLSLHEA